MTDSTYLRGYEQATQKMAVRKDITSALNRLADADQLALLFELIAERETPDVSLNKQRLNGQEVVDVPLRARGAAVIKLLSEAKNGLLLSEIASRVYIDEDHAKNIANARSLMGYLQKRDRVTLTDDRYYIAEKIPVRARVLSKSRNTQTDDASIAESLERIVLAAPKGLTIAETYDAFVKSNPTTTTSKVYVSIALKRLERDKRTLRSRRNNWTNRSGNKIYYARANGGATK